MKLVKRQYLFVNCEDARHSSYGSFSVFLPPVETGQNVRNRMFIKKAIIPYNWKSVDTGTNAVIVDATTYTLTNGNPNILDLVDELNALLNPKLTVTFNRIKSRLEWYNTTGSIVTLDTTANRVLGIPSAVSISPTSTYTSTNIVDVRPTPIIEIRVDLPTAGEEVINAEIRNTGLLLAIGMDVPAFSTKIWVDDNGLYFSELTDDQREITFTMTDVHGTPIIPQSSPYYVIGVDTYRDDEVMMLNAQQEALRLQRYDIMLRHGGK